MAYKQIALVLLLSYVIVQGSSQTTCVNNAALTAAVSRNICSDLSYAICHFCLGDDNADKKQTYKIKFQSNMNCEEVRGMLSTTSNTIASVTSDECRARAELQVDVILSMLQQVCKANGIKHIEYLDAEQRSLCDEVDPTGQCHYLECITNKHSHMCDNIDEVIELLLSEQIDQEEYIVMFNQTKVGRKRCTKTARDLNKLQKKLKDEDVVSKVHTKNCKESERLLLCTLDHEALKWVCQQNQITRVTFEEKYFNESICRNVTRAQEFFSGIERFNVSYLTSDNSTTGKCKRLVKNLRKPDINALITPNNCEETPPHFQAELNYEQLKSVCSLTSTKKVAVVQNKEATVTFPTLG